MKFKASEDTLVEVYGPGDSFDGRMVKQGEVIDVHFTDVVESYFHADVQMGLVIPFDQAALDWACKHMEVACC